MRDMITMRHKRRKLAVIVYYFLLSRMFVRLWFETILAWSINGSSSYRYLRRSIQNWWDHTPGGGNREGETLA